MVVASSAFYFLSLRQLVEPAPSEPPAQPLIVPVAVPQEEIPEPTPPPPPRRVQPTHKTFRAVVAKPAAPKITPTVIIADLPVLEIAESELPTIADAPLPPPPPPQTVTLPAGTLIQVRLAERLATDRNLEGDAFVAILDRELVANGWVIAELGARVLGRITQLDQAGRVAGTASMAIELTSLTTSDGQKIPLHTASFLRKADTSKKSDAVKIAVGTAIGAAIGATAGGGKGAAIGAGAGGAAGVGTVLATRGQPAVLDIETRLSFRLDDPVTITERR